MRKLNHMIIYMLSIVLTVWLPSCSDEEYPVPPDDSTVSYLTLYIGVSSASRSTTPTPSWGDDGYIDYEVGTENENRISNLTLFIYDHADGPNAPEDTPFLHSVYASDSTLDAILLGGYKVPLDTFIPKADYRALVVANMGDLTGIENMGQLRSRIVEKAWTEGEKTTDCTDFTMASAYSHDGIVEELKSGTSEKYFRVKMTVERTAARLDWWFDRENVEDDKNVPYDALRYAVKYEDTRCGTVHIEKMLVVNSMQKGSYVMKHMTVGVSDDMSCFNTFKVCSPEVLSGGKPGNYVLEPNTSKKVKTVDNESLQAWYGATAAYNVRKEYTGLFDKTLPIVDMTKLESPQNEHDYIIPISYLNENTQHLSGHDSRFMTGLVLKTVYEPTTVYKDADKSEDADYKKGTTFWRYSPTHSDMRETDCLYFSNESAAVDYAKANPADLAVITKYTEGVAYYNIWLRHAEYNSDPHRTYPMEYGTVRNTIYRISASFSGPGTPGAEVSEPHNIRFRVFVRKWNLRTHPEIIM